MACGVPPWTGEATLTLHKLNETTLLEAMIGIGREYPYQALTEPLDAAGVHEPNAPRSSSRRDLRPSLARTLAA